MASVSSPSRDLQVRSPRQLMASRRLQSNKSLIQEVRNSLTMPGSPVLTNEAMDSLTPTTPPKQQPRIASARLSFDELDAETVTSTRSTRSVFSTMFRRRKKTDSNDDVSISSTKSWWQKKRGRFKMKNPLKRRRKKRTEQQMVADFFDVQSVASAPETQRRKQKRGVKNSGAFETRSVTSQRSSRSIGFQFLFRRKKVDELESDFLQAGGGIIDASEEMCILGDDEEITLGSGLDDCSYAGSVDAYSVESRDSLKSVEGRSLVKKPKTFLDRIVKRRKRKKRTTHLRIARHDATSISETTSVESDLRSRRPSPQRKVPRSERSVRSLNDLPMERSLNRWDSGRSLASDPTAPKQPQRRSEPPESAPRKSAEESQLADSRNVQSMRHLSSNQNIHEEDEDDGSDGDDSVLSLLSGLLAAWSEEQQRDRSLAVGSSLITSQSHIRGILKTSKKLQEHKEADRQVVFDSIEIREYERIVGDNPSCTRGPPISIGWSYYVLQRCDIEYYENSVRPPPRSKKEFHLTADRRTQLLLNEWQYPEEELQKARREATYVQYCRAKTSFSGSRVAAKEAAFLRKANSRPKPPGGTIPLTRVSNDLSVESMVSAAIKQQPLRKNPPGDAMSIGSSTTGTSVTLDLAASSSIESEA